MNSSINPDEIYYIVNAKGRKTHILLPIEKHEHLVEDQKDKNIADSHDREETNALKKK